MSINISTGNIIPVKSSFISGSDFISSLISSNIRGELREQLVEKELISGNIPNFLRNFKPITVTNNKNTLTYLVMSDYLSIGDDENYIRMPMAAKTAKIIAEKYDCSLPTKKMVIDIYNSAAIKLAAKPWGPPYSNMDDNKRYLVQNNKINEQLDGLDATNLIAGHAKDIILDKRLITSNNKVGIFGWFKSDGTFIQDTNVSSHSIDYTDYSQLTRLVVNDVILDGKLMRLSDIFLNKEYCSLITDQGVYDPRNIYK